MHNDIPGINEFDNFEEEAPNKKYESKFNHIK